MHDQVLSLQGANDKQSTKLKQLATAYAELEAT
jgi:hypothetical protein